MKQLVSGEVYSSNDILPFTATGDLESIAEWMDVSLQGLVFVYRQVPMTVFAKQAEEMFGTYGEFPKDKRRTDKIAKIIKLQPQYPVFVEETDEDNFIMEGRHRIVAFWQSGMQQVPVFYVRKK